LERKLKQRDRCREKQADQREQDRGRGADLGQVERERRRGGKQQVAAGMLMPRRSAIEASRRPTLAVHMGDAEAQRAEKREVIAT